MTSPQQIPFINRCANHAALPALIGIVTTLLTIGSIGLVALESDYQVVVCFYFTSLTQWALLVSNPPDAIMASQGPDYSVWDHPPTSTPTWPISQHLGLSILSS